MTWRQTALPTACDFGASLRHLISGLSLFELTTDRSASRPYPLRRQNAALAFGLRLHNVRSVTPRIFTAELWLPRPRAEVFQFFGDAANLEAITPPWVNFHVLTPGPITMKPGTIIDYRLRIHGFPLRWRTEITAWDPPVRFVDEQRRGPYRLWRHTHTFEEKDGGTLCHDRVEYAAPGGALIEKLFVNRDVERIFAFRQEAMKKLLGNPI